MHFEGICGLKTELNYPFKWSIWILIPKIDVKSKHECYHTCPNNNIDDSLIMKGWVVLAPPCDCFNN